MIKRFYVLYFLFLAYEIHLSVHSEYVRACRLTSSSCQPNNIMLGPLGATAQTILCSGGKICRPFIL